MPTPWAYREQEVQGREQASIAGSASSKPGWWGPSPGTWVQQLGWGPRLAVSNELPGDVDQPACGAQ